MKRIIIVLLLVAAGHITFGQAFIDDVFAKYAGKTGFTSVVITPQLFEIGRASCRERV